MTQNRYLITVVKIENSFVRRIDIWRAGEFFFAPFFRFLAETRLFHPSLWPAFYFRFHLFIHHVGANWKRFAFIFGRGLKSSKKNNIVNARHFNNRQVVTTVNSWYNNNIFVLFNPLPHTAHIWFVFSNKITITFDLNTFSLLKFK